MKMKSLLFALLTLLTLNQALAAPNSASNEPLQSEMALGSMTV
ncbi:hypothetical protein Dxin01_00838 [Deinococcus xinjiangensis]|uniref:Uncharacterized protein n=1 Tax=Deinococcus xinjiangensis TaxID=457454 RepID=A0ABP9V764_9DEIO